ncbi:PREDICTED: uncharacterized protein LOC109227698 [Nicotiana attenuata]|uniref:uncharacterized protein LOC109227698 n=1 Tax=Nicotiana attenuata TaxID=49451 RepID=UPI00090567E5|nr:PREDICTED: uncharacterized protein LOC109227698 [Nicotiana attenuata]
MVTSWILNSLSKEIADSVEYASDAVELRKELEDRYEQTNGARLYQIQKEINDLSQGNLDITTYYTKLKKLWEELATLSKRNQCNCICNCGAKENMYKAEQDRRLIQFLMGLNEVYTVVRGSILMMNPLPNLAQAFSALVQDGKQREIRPNNHLIVDSASLNVGSSGQNSFRTNFRVDNNRGLSRGRLICDYCKRPGHSKDRCYKLHGYPQNFSAQNPGPRQFSNSRNYDQGPRYNNNKGKRVVANVQGITDEITTGEEAENKAQDDGKNVSLTQEQYGQLISMIVCTSSIDFGKLACKCFESKADTWILDSGASNHMTFDKSLLSNVQILPYPLLVVLPNGYKVKVSEIGDVVLTSKIVLQKVLFIPSFKFNLVSVYWLTKHLRGMASFTDNACLLQAPSVKRPLEIGKVRNGLYLLCSKCLRNNNTSVTFNHSCDVNSPLLNNTQSHMSSSVNESLLKQMKNNPTSFTSSSLNDSLSKSAFCFSNGVDILWHNRLGHVPFVKMKHISNIPAVFPKNNHLCAQFVLWPDKQDFPFYKRLVPPPKTLN